MGIFYVESKIAIGYKYNLIWIDSMNFFEQRRKDKQLSKIL